VLVAEDNRTNQKVICKQLQLLGYESDVAATGVEVMAALEREHYHVILMDIQMPEMDGTEAIHLIRTHIPTAQQPYIIALTADALEGSRERYLQLGADDYISKPVRTDTLRAALDQCRQAPE
jgi:CheY-like chemotaxis protein